MPSWVVDQTYSYLIQEVRAETSRFRRTRRWATSTSSSTLRTRRKLSPCRRVLAVRWFLRLPLRRAKLRLYSTRALRSGGEASSRSGCNVTRDEAIAEIQWHLGNRSDLFDQIAPRRAWAQRQFETGRTVPWLLLEEDATLSLMTGSADGAFPTGFLREYEDEAFHYTGVDGAIYLEKTDLRNGNRRFADEDSGPPQDYAIREKGWKFWHERDIGYGFI